MVFEKLAPYLKDPLVLIGFMLFLAFLFSRKLLSSGIIPPIGSGRGAKVLRLLLHYGFAIGILIILLGFGLKYRDMSEQEQKTAIGLLHSELRHNAYVATELLKNTITLTNAASTVAGVLRIERLRINSGLFPAENLDTRVEENADLYNQRFDWLVTSGLLKDKTELRRFREQNAAITRTVDRTITTVMSLGDRNASRYVIQDAAYHANLPVLRKVTVVRVEDIASLYAKTSEVREKYFRIAESVIEYLTATKSYCLSDVPDRAALGAALAAERLTMRLLASQKTELQSLADEIARQAESMQLGRIES